MAIDKETDAIHYQLFFDNPGSHQIKIILKIDKPGTEQRLWMPAWIPGSYKIRDYAKNITHISAKDALGDLPLKKINLHQWICHPRQGALIITYFVYAFDRSVRGAHFDTTHAFLNGCAVFLAVSGKEKIPHQVTLESPLSADYRDWRVATTLPRLSGAPEAFGDFEAQDYDALIDHPIEIGRFEKFEWESGGCPHTLVVTGQRQGDIDRLLQDLKSICNYAIAFFGEPPPMPSYLFLLSVTEEDYGGLEHRQSTALMCRRYDFPKVGSSESSAGYQELLGLFSHEYFHLWHVKRIKPAEFLNYDLSQPNCTEQLWIYEGFTAYYDDLILLRSKVISMKQYCQLQEKNISRFWRTKGRYLQSAASASFDAWIKLYQPTENSSNTEVSYYNKGSLIAFCLDIAMRHATAGTVTLDSLMRWLWQTYGKTQLGTEPGAIEDWVAAHAGQGVADGLRRWVYEPGDLPIQETWGLLGVELQRQMSKKTDHTSQITLGIRLSFHASGAKIEGVETGSPAENAGLSAGDILLALNHVQVHSKNYSDLLDYQSAGTSLTVHVFRDKILRSFVVTPISASQDTAVIRWDPNQSSDLAKRWMEGL